jgi:hypothetical protein
MRIKHIYITKEGEPMANPEMEYPEGKYKSDESGFNFDEALAKYHSGLLRFEDKKDALDFIPWEYHGYNGAILSQYWDTLIPVDIEVEVVSKEQEEWTDYLTVAKSVKSVIRIKP